MIARVLAAVFLAGVGGLHAAPTPLSAGQTHRLIFRDVDGNQLSTSEGHVTIMTVVTRADEDKARIIADLVPDRYVGNAQYMYVTLVNFEGKLPSPLHGLTRAIIRNRLATEARELKPQYATKKITRNPRGDLHVIADFDGKAVEQLGLPLNNGGVAVFVFDGVGKLIARWEGVPPDDSLARALEKAR